MIHNDVLRSVRHMLNVHDDSLAAIARLGGAQITSDEITAYLKREEDPGYRACPNGVMASFLDGLIIHRRGPRDGERPPVTHVSNNVVLKKLRVAFELRDDDVVAMMTAAGFTVSKPEMNALFRNPDHPNFRACGDQFLRNFLKSLTARVRPTNPPKQAHEK